MVKADIVQHRVGPETERMRMRAFEPDDAAAFHRLTSDPEIIRYTGEPPSVSVQACRDAIAQYPDFRVQGFGRWACILKSTGEIVGFSGLKRLADWQCVDLGYRFLPKCWGQGLATESGRASLHFAFDTLGLSEVHGFVLPANVASRRVLEKLGMLHVEDVQYDGDTARRYVVTGPQWAAHCRSRP